LCVRACDNVTTFSAEHVDRVLIDRRWTAGTMILWKVGQLDRFGNHNIDAI